jgi:hypothetical protein
LGPGEAAGAAFAAAGARSAVTRMATPATIVAARLEAKECRERFNIEVPISEVETRAR